VQIPYLIALFVIAAAIGVCAVAFPEGVSAIVIVTILSATAISVFHRTTDEPQFITKLFFGALAVRIVLGIAIYLLDLSSFFGPDAETYHYRGGLVVDYWNGLVPGTLPEVVRFTATTGAGWGMHYLVAGIYFIVGKNALAAQALVWVAGAATAPLAYLCSGALFKNRRVAQVSAFAVALFPSFVLWSAQLVKDGLILFLLVLVMLMVLRLQERFRPIAVGILVLAMFGILSLRFYIFYMVAFAIIGSFVIGIANTPAAIVRRTVILIVMGLGLTYLGVLGTATIDIEKYGSLESVQRSRLDLAQSAESGFGEDLDVSTTEGALTALPVGFMYLMFAPFPWQVSSLRQAITLPEVLAWWAMMPMMAWGIWYTIKHRLREAFPILIFSLMLTLAYSIFQGNVGTAYRQRTQIQVFLFMFIGVGYTLYKERKEDRRLVIETRRRQMRESVRARSLTQ